MGGKVEMGDGASPEVFNPIAEVRKVTISGNKVDFADVTNIQSPNNYKEFIPTLIEAGELSFECNYIPADTTQASLVTARDARTKHNWKVVLPSTLGNITFAGFVSSIDPSLDYSKEATLSVKVKITGAVTLAYSRLLVVPECWSPESTYS